MIDFLHGVETIIDTTGSKPVSVIKTAVVGLVGIAPKGDAQKLIVVNNPSEAAQFGLELPGFNIPQTINAIQNQGGATIMIVNIWDETAMADAVADEEIEVADRKAKTEFVPVQVAATVVKNEAGDVTYVEGTDYTIDAFGNIVALVAGIADEDILKVTYKKIDAAAVTSTLLIGANTSGVRTGSVLFELAFNTFGYRPKIFIMPGYAEISAVKNQLIILADKYRGDALIDNESEMIVADAIADRGPAGVAFNTSSKRAILLYPNLKGYAKDPSILDTSDDKIIEQPYSMYFAGVMCSNIRENGYWFSASNREIKGIAGPAIAISAGINDPDTEANALNKAGIVTVFNSFGTGVRSWGNRSAAYPTDTHVSNFTCVRTVQDVINESIEEAMLPYIDKPIVQAQVDAVRDTVNIFLNLLISRGALVDGKNPTTGRSTGCYFNAADSDLAAGHINFDTEFCPPTPMEWITFKSHIDTTYLASIA